MRIRLSRMTLSAVALAALALLPARADEAADLYFAGFQAGKAGEALEKEGKRASALIKFREAIEKISEVQAQFPGWQPDVVKYRLRVLHRRLAELVPLPQARVPAPTAPPAASQATPYILKHHPRQEFFNRPAIPFIFNGKTYYKMLLSHQREAGPVMER